MRISDWSSDVVLFRSCQHQQHTASGFAAQEIPQGRICTASFHSLPSFLFGVFAGSSGFDEDIQYYGLHFACQLIAYPERSEERRVGTGVSVSVDLGGSRIIKKKKKSRTKLYEIS